MATYRGITLGAAIGIAVLEVWLFTAASSVAYPPRMPAGIDAYSSGAVAPLATVKSAPRLPSKRTHLPGARPGVRSK